jgi:hypothetical protein
LASAKAVYFGQRGEVTEHAERLGVSRQSVYRQAESALEDLDDQPLLARIADLNQQVKDLQTRLRQSQEQQAHAALVTPEIQAEFASTAQAEGLSLPGARRLLCVLLKDKAPSVAALGRLSRQAALRAGALLWVLDEHARPLVRQANGDELFFGPKPVLMLVEPSSQYWAAGRISPNRQQRQKKEQPLLTDQLDHFHTLRQGRRGLRKTQARAERAWAAAEEADKKVARRRRKGKARTGYQTQAVLKWKRAFAAFQEWDEAGVALEGIRQALRPFTPEGELNTRERAEVTIKALAATLRREQWDKFKRALARPETYSFLDRMHKQVETLPVSQEVREAVVLSEGARQNPQLLKGEGPKQGARRGLLVVWSVLIHGAGEAGKQAVEAVREMVHTAGRSSSSVEGLNSVFLMQQGRHRKMTQELLDLKRLYWNWRPFRTGKRKDTCPCQRLGLRLPRDLSWWQLLQLSPDNLRLLLSAPNPDA